LVFDFDFGNVVSETLPALLETACTYMYQSGCFPNPSQLSKVIWKVGPWIADDLESEKRILSGWRKN
jgi:hypothetical protein